MSGSADCYSMSCHTIFLETLSYTLVQVVNKVYKKLPMKVTLDNSRV